MRIPPRFPYTLITENFKGLNGRREFEMHPLTILVGPNNSGKSTISKAIEFLGFLDEQSFESHEQLFNYNFESIEFTTKFGKLEDLIHSGEETFSIGYYNQLGYYEGDEFSDEEQTLFFEFTFNEKQLLYIDVNFNGKEDINNEPYTQSYKIYENYREVKAYKYGFNWADEFKYNYDKMDKPELSVFKNELYETYLDILQTPKIALHKSVALNSSYDCGQLWPTYKIFVLASNYDLKLVSFKEAKDWDLYKKIEHCQYTLDEFVLFIIDQAILEYMKVNSIQLKEHQEFNSFKKLLGEIAQQKIDITEFIIEMCKYYCNEIEGSELIAKIALWWLENLNGIPKDFDSINDEKHKKKLFIGAKGNRLTKFYEHLDVEYDELKYHFKFDIYSLQSIIEIGIHEDSYINNLKRFTQIVNARNTNLSQQKYFDFDTNNSFIDLIKRYEKLNETNKKKVDDKVREWLILFEIGNDFEIITSNSRQTFELFITEIGTELQRKHTAFGAGISQIFQVILHTVMYSEISKENKGLILEEPELFMHPALQSKLGELFYESLKYILHVGYVTITDKDGSNSRPNFDTIGNTSISDGIIIETHSEYLIRQIQVLIAQDEKNDALKAKTQGVKLDSKRNGIIIHYLGSPEEKERTFPIEIRKNGSLTRNFGPGFYDESSNLTLDLLNLNMN